ncbi:MAG: hypothetical protein KH218_11935 [Klebsiella sp.]|uniref:hypothetical protein n=1 Tax=Klebsiella TaxID=570 RepID=UPI00257AE81A|nr:hypothetical protein [Klebsiella sp.]HDT5902843.1 hypothetical protein [Klebsiella michiganensis]MBS6908070.1 hypothetical protein [Klebsiella sp.]HDT5948103.1 hypothetical protein [Klebsiella michiganensis]HDT5970525.1 hypothetical protein [Klebsiella michiganensis]HDT5981465.1 hypothetical protein [Klebsiella michiganensis]
MARPKKIVETPGQEKAAPEEKTLVTEGQLITAEQNGAQQQGNGSDEQTVQQKVSTLLDGTQLAERNAILATLNAQGAAIVARFEEYAFTDSLNHPLTNNLDFLNLVRKATDVSTGGTAEQMTNEEGKKQPVRSAPVLTEHGWHVPG